MTKAVKVYRGDVAADSATTIYTVPVGRIAKVTFAYLYNSGPTGTVAIAAGGRTFFSAAATGSGCGFPASAKREATSVGSSMLMSDHALIAGQFQSNSNNTVDGNSFIVVPRDVYLVAGDTVTVRYGIYSFVVVEEY